MVSVAVAGVVSALATGLGAVPVWFLGARAERLRPVLWGFAAGVMAIASWSGLLDPALDEGDTASVAGGLAAGVAFLVLARLVVRRHEAVAHPGDGARGR